MLHKVNRYYFKHIIDQTHRILGLITTAPKEGRVPFPGSHIPAPPKTLALGWL